MKGIRKFYQEPEFIYRFTIRLEVWSNQELSYDAVDEILEYTIKKYEFKSGINVHLNSTQTFISSFVKTN